VHGGVVLYGISKFAKLEALSTRLDMPGVLDLKWQDGRAVNSK
jgi:hypothetical protein